MRFLGVCLLALSVSSMGYATNLKAIVNDTPIFESEVVDRMALLKAQQPQVYQEMKTTALKKAALESLVDEYLKIQKSQELGMKISEDEVDQAIQHLEQQNGFSVGGLKRLLDEQNVPMKTLRQQVYGDLVWLSYVRSKIKQVSIPASAVKARLQEIKKDMSKATFTVAEIQVPTLEQAQDIWQDLQEGASFAEMAQKYSKAKTSKSGGYVGVIEANHYGSDVAPILKEMPAGQLSRPIAVKKGYLLIYMVDKKAAITNETISVWELAQGGVADNADTSAITNAKNCVEFKKAIEKDGISSSIQQGWMDPYQLPAELKNMLEDMAVNEVLGPVRVPQGKLFFMKCQVKAQRVLPTDEEVKEQLEMAQMEIQAKRLLDAEKREAVIEYK